MNLIYRDLLHSCTLKTKDQKEKLKKQSQLSSHKKRIRYLGTNLPKEIEDLYSKNYKHWWETSEMMHRGRHTMFLNWKSQCCQMTIPAKAIYRFSAIFFKLQMAFFHRTRRKNIKACVPGSAVPGKGSTWQHRRCRRLRFHICIGKVPWRRKWHPTPVFLPRKFHGQRSLAI